MEKPPPKAIPSISFRLRSSPKVAVESLGTDLNCSESSRPPLPFAPPHSATASCSKGRLIRCTVPGLTPNCLAMTRTPGLPGVARASRIRFWSAGAIGGRPRRLPSPLARAKASTDSFRNHRRSRSTYSCANRGSSGSISRGGDRTFQAREGGVQSLVPEPRVTPPATCRFVRREAPGSFESCAD
jgi:hypothetical protein